THTDSNGNPIYQSGVLNLLRDLNLGNDWETLCPQCTENISEGHTIVSEVIQFQQKISLLQGPFTERLKEDCSHLLCITRGWVAAEEEIMRLMGNGQQALEDGLFAGQLGRLQKCLNKHQLAFLEENTALGAQETRKRTQEEGTRENTDSEDDPTHSVHQHTAINVTKRVRVGVSTSYYWMPPPVGLQQPPPSLNSPLLGMSFELPSELDDQYIQDTQDTPWPALADKERRKW
ncbi:hypothetical protein PAXRUDRAFT_168578, partial [Paxillus rubicundulus Ve08.2h10]